SGTRGAEATTMQPQAGNPQVQNPISVYQCGSSGCSEVGISVSAAYPVYVSFYGTGIRNASSLSNVSVSINGMSQQVLYAGPAPGFTGLDQVNVALDPSLSQMGS